MSLGRCLRAQYGRDLKLSYKIAHGTHLKIAIKTELSQIIHNIRTLENAHKHQISKSNESKVNVLHLKLTYHLDKSSSACHINGITRETSVVESSQAISSKENLSVCVCSCSSKINCLFRINRHRDYKSSCIWSPALTVCLQKYTCSSTFLSFLTLYFFSNHSVVASGILHVTSATAVNIS